MRKTVSALFCLLLLLTSCASINKSHEPSTQEREELSWAKKICLSAEYGFSSNRVIKWAHPVKVSVIRGQITADVIEIINGLNYLLEDTNVSVALLQYPDKTADIELYLTEYGQFPSIARENKFHYADGNWGYFYGFWNSKHELKKAYILIATDILQGDQLKHFLLEEIIQSFGLMNDSRTYIDSIFYSGNEHDFEYSSLSPRDRKLVKLIYSKLNAGDTQKQFEEAFMEYWKDL